MKKIVILFFIMVFLFLPIFSAHLEPLLRYAEAQKGDSETAGYHLTFFKGEPAVKVLVAAQDQSFFREHDLPFNEIGGEYVSAVIPVSLLPEAAAREGLGRIEPQTKVFLYNDVAIPKIRSDYLNMEGYTGEDILVGVVDTGIDIDHPAFLDNQGESRILYIWDQEDTSGTGVNVGSFSSDTGKEWTKADIDNGLCTQIDGNGHGTHVAGSIGGYDSDYPARQGSAVAANIIFVKTNFYDINEGVQYIYERAKILGKPVVVNLSLGSQWGPHDGTGAREAAMDSLIEEADGDLFVVISAGNDGNKKIHGYADDVGSTPKTVDFNIASYTPMAGEGNDYVALNFYYDSLLEMEVRVTDSGGSVSDWFAPGEHNEISGDGTHVYVYNGEHDADTRHIQIILGDYNFDPEVDESDRYIRPGTQWALEFRVSAGTVSRLDGWIYERINGTSGRATFEGMTDPTGMSLNYLACGQHTICVAAYTSKAVWASMSSSSTTFNYTQDAVTPFSSRGPTRDGRPKPDITAPGSVLLSARSSDAPAPSGYYLPADGSHEFYRYMQGTSMSAPAAAGGIALIKEANPEWDQADVVQYFRYYSQGTDVYTWAPNNWSPEWGWGVLDVSSALTVNDIPQKNMIKNRPNPFSPDTVITYTVKSPAKVTIRIYDQKKRLVASLVQQQISVPGEYETVWDGKDRKGKTLPSGLYYAVMEADGKPYLRKMVLLK